MPDGFSLYNPEQGTTFYDIAPGPDHSQRLEETILDKFPSNEEWDEISCIVETTRLLFLPADITDANLQKEMFDVTFSPSEDEEMLITSPLSLASGQDILLCFGISKDIYNFLLRNYENVNFCHPITTLLEEGVRMAQGNCLVVRCNERYLELALFRNKKLQFCNTFHTTHAENRTYYVMNTWRQQGLDQLEDYLLVLGGTNEGLQVRASTHRFIKHVFS